MEQSRSASCCSWCRSGHDLWKAAELSQRVAFGDALGAKAHIDVAIQPGDDPCDALGHAWVNGAPQDDDLAIPQVIREWRDGTGDGIDVRAEVAVHRSSHDYDNMFATGDRSRIRGGTQVP